MRTCQTNMTRPQRILLITYFLLVTCCCLWVPWIADFEGLKEVHQGNGWIWSPPTDVGVPSLAAIVTRILALSGLSGAAFLLSKRWKILLVVTVSAGLGMVVYHQSTKIFAQRRIRAIHECAVAKVSAAKCTPAEGQFQVCDPYVLSENATSQEVDVQIEAAQKECIADLNPRQKSVHDEIEEYRRKHGLK